MIKRQSKVVAKTSINWRPFYASQLAVLATWIMLQILFSIAAHAQALPPGTLVDVQGLNDESGIICSTYIKNKKTSYYLSKAAGGKLFGKRYIDATGLRIQIAAVKKDIASMTPRAKKDKKIKKALKKAVTLRNNLTAANKGLRACKTNYSEHKEDSGVRFEHVQSVLQKRCLSCHGVLGWTNSEDFYRESGRMAPGNIEASPLYTFLNGNPEGYIPATMPKGGAPLSQLDLMLISNWIADATEPAPPPGAPIATPTPGGEIGEGRDLYQLHCAACHGNIDQSSKFGRTAEQIKAAIGAGGPPQMNHLKILTDEQIAKIAGALAIVQPAIEGTLAIKNIGPVTEGGPGDGPIKFLQFEVKLTGKTSAPFTVGYVTSNGTALADSDYLFGVGTVQFAGNDGESHIISVDVLTDTFQESDETMYVDIGGVSTGAVLISTASASGTIINDDVFDLISPPASSKVLMAYNFNTDYKDSLGDSDAVPQSDVTISPSSKIGAGAVAFDSATDYLTVPGTKLATASSFTFASWVYWENSTSTSSRVFDFGVSTSNYIFFAPSDSQNRCRFELRGSGAITTTFTLQCPTASKLPANKWVHLATIFSPATNEMKIYFDGVLIASRNDVTPDLSAITFTDNRLGKSRAASSVDFVGRLDETMVWDEALTQDQIVALAAMTESSTFNSSMKVNLSSGVLVPNGSVLDIGSVETGKDFSTTIFVKNSGPVGLALLGQPNVEIGGDDASSFSIKVQPMPWHADLAMNSYTAFTLRYSPKLPGPKTATVLIDNTDLLDGGYAIGLKANATGPALEDEEAGETSGDSPELSQGKALYVANCSSCHGQLNVSTKSGKTLASVTAAMNPTTGIPQMKALGAVLTADEVAKIVMALNAPVLQPATDSVVVEEYLPNVGTATYVAETLKDIFLPPGPTSSYTGVDGDIWKVISENVLGLKLSGSPLYNTGRAMFFSRRCQRFDGVDVCPAEQYNNLMRPIPDTIRAGWYKQTCDLVTEKDLAITNALSKVGLTVNAPITPQTIKTIYEALITPGRAMPQYMADIVSTFPVQAPNLSSTDKYRFILNQFCISGVLEGM